MSKYLVHKAIEVANCKVAVRNKLHPAGYLENNYRAFAKYDGCCTVAIVSEDGVSYQSRTGEDANLHHLDKELLARFGDICRLNDTTIVVFGEAWWPGKDQFPQISGAFRRHAGDSRLQLAVFDVVTLEEFDLGHSSLTFNERHQRLLSAFKPCPANDNISTPQVFPAREYKDTDYVSAKSLAEALVTRGGYDGLIMRDPQGAWLRGSSGNTGEIIKVKHRVSIDVRCTGVVEGKGKQAGMAGSLNFTWRGKECNVGTGLNDVQRIEYLRLETQVVGKIIEVECLGFTPEGIPREPSYKGVRFDKLAADDE